MIIVSLSGGLGNQMFQYAAGYSLARRLNEELYIEIGEYDRYKAHNGYELGEVFGISSPEAKREDIERILGWQGSYSIRRVTKNRHMRFLRRKSFIVEPHYHFWSDFFFLSNNIFLNGFWQSSKYFNERAGEIRKIYSFRNSFNGENLEFARRIKRGNSISIHVRRGDYLATRKAQATHGTCSLDYYCRAMMVVEKEMDDISYFVFSDDIDWVADNLKFSKPVYFVNINRGKESYRDMHLISMCRHNIIANSSFSWWGAWLNANPERVVIAPKLWFVDNRIETKDLYEKNWIKI